MKKLILPLCAFLLTICGGCNNESIKTANFIYRYHYGKIWDTSEDECIEKDAVCCGYLDNIAVAQEGLFYEHDELMQLKLIPGDRLEIEYCGTIQNTLDDIHPSCLFVSEGKIINYSVKRANIVSFEEMNFVRNEDGGIDSIFSDYCYEPNMFVVNNDKTCTPLNEYVGDTLYASLYYEDSSGCLYLPICRSIAAFFSFDPSNFVLDNFYF